MAADAPVATSFAERRGLVAEWGLSWLLPRLVGPAVALGLLLSSRRVSGAEAAELGVVNAALPADDVLAHSRRYVEGPAERESQRLMPESFGRPDVREGVRSFLDERRPHVARLGG